MTEFNSVPKPDPRYIELIARLRTFRIRKNVTQSDLASKVAKPQSYISKVESFGRKVDVIELIDLCGALGLRLVDLLPESLKDLL